MKTKKRANTSQVEKEREGTVATWEIRFCEEWKAAKALDCCLVLLIVGDKEFI